jgi:hypothetical protein
MLGLRLDRVELRVQDVPGRKTCVPNSRPFVAAPDQVEAAHVIRLRDRRRKPEASDRHARFR